MNPPLRIMDKVQLFYFYMLLTIKIVLNALKHYTGRLNRTYTHLMVYY